MSHEDMPTPIDSVVRVHMHAQVQQGLAQSMVSCCGAFEGAGGSKAASGVRLLASCMDKGVL